MPNITIPSIQWITAYITLEAHELTLATPDHIFHGQETPRRITSDKGGVIEKQLGVLRATTLEVEWVEHAVNMRLNFYFHANNTHWWVYEIRTHDGSEAENWIYYSDNGPYLRTPVGAVFQGDVVFESDALNAKQATLRFKALQLRTIF